MPFSKSALLPISWSNYTLKKKVSLSLLHFLLRNNTTLGIFTIQHKHTISRLPKSLVMVITYNYWSPRPTVFCMKRIYTVIFAPVLWHTKGMTEGLLSDTLWASKRDEDLKSHPC